MDYKPLKDVMNYLRKGYDNLTERVGSLLSPNSGLELAVAGIPNGYSNKLPIEIQDKLQGYSFASKGNKGGAKRRGSSSITYTRAGRSELRVTWPDGVTVSFLKSNMPPSDGYVSYVKGHLEANERPSNNKIAKRIAAMLRERN